MLNDPCIGCFSVSIIYSSISLKINLIQKLRFKTHASVFQCSKAVVKISIHRTSIDNLIRQTVPVLPVFQIILLQPDLNAFKHILHQPRIPSNRNPLIQRIKIIIIKGKTYRQTFDDKCRQLTARTSPLLLRISLDQLFINIGSYQRDCLLFQVLRLYDMGLSLLLLNLLCGFLWCYHTPHFIKGIHIKRKTVQLPLVISHRTVGKAVKVCIFCHIVPYHPVIGMKNMCTIPVYMDSFYILCVNIPGNMISFINNKHLFSCFSGFTGKYGTEKSRSNYQIIIHSLSVPLYSSF